MRSTGVEPWTIVDFEDFRRVLERAYPVSKKNKKGKKKVIISITAIDEYFAQPDTPAANSPVGVLMSKIIGENPGITFEDARAEATKLGCGTILQTIGSPTRPDCYSRTARAHAHGAGTTYVSTAYIAFSRR